MYFVCELYTYNSAYLFAFRLIVPGNLVTRAKSDTLSISITPFQGANVSFNFFSACLYKEVCNSHSAVSVLSKL